LRLDNWKLIFAFLFISMASHGVLDAFTSGGLGPALFWPFDDTRYFAPISPIRVSPIGAGFFSARGVAVLFSEALWVWMPAALMAVAGRALLRHVR
jgi:inner membrane protein